MTTEPDNFPHPLQQMNRQNAILEHTNEILKQELNQMVEELAKYRSSLRGYEGAHTRIEQLEQQLAQAREEIARLQALNETQLETYRLQRENHQAENAAMRALLERVSKGEPHADWTIDFHEPTYPLHEAICALLASLEG